MRINRYLDIYGGITLEAMAEGRFVVLDTTDEPGIYGVRLPDDATDAGMCHAVVAWPPTNIDPPYYTPMPTVAWSLRQGFDKTANDPFDAEVSMVYPGNRDSSTIPSGTLVRLFPEHSVVTLTSGNFVDSANLAKGAMVSVSYSGTDAGKPQYDAAGTIAVVEEYDSGNLVLTLRLK
jgi:hypothetical protein